MEQLDKRQLILAAAGDVFATQGYHRATIEQIAEKAGVGKGTVYLYFKSKQGLFDALLLEGSEWMLKSSREVLSKSDDPLERIRMLIQLHLQIIKRNHPLMRMIIQEFTPGKLKELRPELGQRVREYQALFALVLEEGIASGHLRQHNPHVIALALIGALSQIGANLNNGRLDISLADCEQELLQMFIVGLQKG
ncbi:MAG: TetR/AcrR family transcriptional regulator [Firmicutes bacterium]|nr:TetR/AcrR family transcriptional regulator [Bacillota bacterium]